MLKTYLYVFYAKEQTEVLLRVDGKAHSPANPCHAMPLRGSPCQTFAGPRDSQTPDLSHCRVEGGGFGSTGPMLKSLLNNIIDIVVIPSQQ